MNKIFTTESPVTISIRKKCNQKKIEQVQRWDLDMHPLPTALGWVPFSPSHPERMHLPKTREALLGMAM